MTDEVKEPRKTTWLAEKTFGLLALALILGLLIGGTLGFVIGRTTAHTPLRPLRPAQLKADCEAGGGIWLEGKCY